MIKVLDHGYVDHIESWGKGKIDLPEAGIIEAARQSTQGSFRGWEKDQKLLKFLWDSKHSSPFEFAGMTIEIQAPIFVFREVFRHRSLSPNEASARYDRLPDINYLPTMTRLMVGDDKANKQAGTIKGAAEITFDAAAEWRAKLAQVYMDIEKLYQEGLSIGIPKEVARICLPVGRYSRARITGNLRMWLAFLTLRLAPDVQQETRDFAVAVDSIIAREFPKTWEIFNDQ